MKKGQYNKHKQAGKALCGLVTLVAAVALAVTPLVMADEEPDTKDATETETNTTCPGMGVCTKVVTPQGMECEYCNGYFFDCGCTCTDGDYQQITYTGDCHIDNIGVPPYYASVAHCNNYTATSTNTVRKPVCWDPN